jgi:tetratricopeptide (TPR) repeat protein
MMNKKEINMKQFSLVLLIIILFAFPSSARADIAPPIYPPGSNLEPGSEGTQVRMAAETVLIDVQDDTTPDSLGSARVTADFSMRNLGSESESMAVRFPISASDGRSKYPEITNLAIKVSGKQVSFRRANYPDIRYYNQDNNVPWAEFDVAFPAGQDVAIQVAYTLNGSGYMPYTAFYYILETGAGWKDTIGSADVILRLPYAASTQNVVMDFQIGWAETTPAGVFDGNAVRWHFDNFEPGPDGPVQNMEFALVAPVSWRSILKARDNVAKNPNDSEAWGHLAMAYKQIFFMNKGYRTDAGGEELYKASIEAYEKCLALNPKDAQWHAGFADLLANRSYWDAWYGPTSDTYRALEEIHTALQLAPNDPKVLEIAQNISYMFPDGIKQKGSGYDFPWLTQTPTSLPSTPTSTLISTSALATDTLAPASTDTPKAGAATPAPQSSSPLCGSAALAPLVAFIGLTRKRKVS